MSHTEKPEECSCCGWATTELRECDAYARTPGHGPFTPDEEKVWAWLCEVCRSTFAGNTYLYPRNYDPVVAQVLPMVAWCANRILAEVKGER